jgi:uncharacterized membrane protein
MNTFSIKECVKFGWETFNKRPWFFVGFSVLVFLVSMVSNTINTTLHDSGMGFLGFLISLLISLYLSFGQIHLFLRAHDSVEQVQANDFWVLKRFGYYILLYLVLTVALIVGFILFIVPGIILALITMFSLYIYIDTELTPIEALKESSRITKGHLWQLFLFSLTLIGINILGALALLVGLFVSVPVSLLATIHVYRSLERISPKNS